MGSRDSYCYCLGYFSCFVQSTTEFGSGSISIIKHLNHSIFIVCCCYYCFYSFGLNDNKFPSRQTCKKTKSTITLMKSGFEQNETQENSANYDWNKHEKA